MQKSVTTYRVDRVLVVTIDNPPVNALSVDVRRGLDAAMQQALDSTIDAVLLLGKGRQFIAGADIREFGQPPQTPMLGDLCNSIEALDKPVVAALHGAVLGGGLEIAMAAHYRISAESAKLGLPEVKLGIMPGAGGTQRAPRLVGVQAALDLMLSGRPIDAIRASELGLVDRVAQEEGLKEAALGYAAEILEAGYGPRRSRDGKGLIAGGGHDELEMAYGKQAQKSPHLFSPFRIIDAVEAALDLPFDMGLKKERDLFTQCLNSPQREGLIHAFFAERAVAKVPALNGVKPRALQTVGVVGGGTMGAGIAVASLQAGFTVIMVERDQKGCACGRQNVERALQTWLKKGRIQQNEYDSLLARFSVGMDYVSLSQANLVVEAAFEDKQVKEAIFAELNHVCAAGTVLASNTSYLDINAFADKTSRPQDVIGLHFFSPAHVMKLLEIVAADQTSAETQATAFAFAKRLKKVAVRAGVCDGFIGNRMLGVYRQVALFLVEDGATPYEIDAAVRDFGYPIGPFQMFDLAGGDIGWAMRKRQAATRDPRDRYVELADKLCERGWFGQKTGRGWYRYDNGSHRGEQDSDVLALIDEERKRVGITPRVISKSEIQERYLASMINVGAEVIADGIALRPLDVDVVLVHGYGFPRHRGGPMCYADSLGLPSVLNRIKRYAEEDARFWQPSALLEKLVAENRDFDSLNKK